MSGFLCFFTERFCPKIRQFSFVLRGKPGLNAVANIFAKRFIGLFARLYRS